MACQAPNGRHLTVSSPTSARRAELDGIRALAILGVLGVHANVGLMRGGHLGVAVFFVLSGYLITTLLTEEFRLTGTVKLRYFYVRRCARLLPALAVVLAAYGLFALAIGEPTRQVLFGVGASALYSVNIVMAFVDSQAVDLFRWAWTLSYEEQFYLLWPFCLLAALRRGRLSWLLTMAVALSALAEVLRCVLPLGSEAALWRLYIGPDTRMDGLLIGCLLALALARHPIGKVERWAAPLGAGAIAVIAVTYTVSSMSRRTTYAVGIIAAELATAALILSVTATRDSWVARVLSVRAVTHVGQISYGLYLWNIPVHHATRHVWHNLAPIPGVLVWLTVTFALAEASHRWVERPVLARVRRSSIGRPLVYSQPPPPRMNRSSSTQRPDNAAGRAQ